MKSGITGFDRKLDFPMTYLLFLSFDRSVNQDGMCSFELHFEVKEGNGNGSVRFQPPFLTLLEFIMFAVKLIPQN